MFNIFWAIYKHHTAPPKIFFADMDVNSMYPGEIVLKGGKGGSYRSHKDFIVRSVQQSMHVPSKHLK